MKLLVFGSLRATSKRGFNFNRFGGQTYLKTLTLPGFVMHSLGAYPAIVPGDGEIVVELHEVDNRSYEYIRRMELGAGYDEKEISLPQGTAKLFVWHDEEGLSKYPIVEKGDWN